MRAPSKTKRQDLEKLTGRQAPVVKTDYEKLLEEAERIGAKSASVYVPLLVEALKKGDPELNNLQIKYTVRNDCGHIWAHAMIAKYWPNWLKNAKRAEYFRRLNDAAKAQKEIKRLFDALPPPDAAYDEDDVGIGKGPTHPLDAYERTNLALDNFWRAWTDGEKTAPYSREDVINDFIKPYSEFRRALIFELRREQLVTTNNQLVATNQLISRIVQDLQEAIGKTAE